MTGDATKKDPFEALTRARAAVEARRAKEQAEQEHKRAVDLLHGAVGAMSAEYGDRVRTMKAKPWIYAMHLDGSISVIEEKTGRVYARSVPGNPRELDPVFVPVSLSTP